MVSYSLPDVVQKEYDRIDAVAGCRGALMQAEWPNASERNVWPVGPGERHEGFYLVNGTFVGIWSSSYGPPVDNLTIQDAHLGGSEMWASRPYQWRDNVTWRHVTVSGVHQEHGLYPTMIGRGTYAAGEPKPTKSEPSLSLDRCRWEYIGSQAVQLTGPRHLYGQTVGTAPNGTSFDFELADTKGGPIVVRDNYAQMVCGAWGKRPAFAYSFREAQHHVLIDGLVLDNRRLPGAQGGVLFEGAVSAINGKLPWFRRHVDARHMIIMQPSASKPPVQVDHVATLRMRECAVFQENERPVRIVRRTEIAGRPVPGRILIEGCMGNVNVQIDGKDYGPITNRIDVQW